MLYFVHIYAILLLYAVYICYFRTGVSEQDVGTLKMGPKRCSETSVRIYHSRLRKNPKESRSRSHCGGIPKWLKSSLVLPHFIHTQPRSINELLNYSNSEREQKFFFCFFWQNIRSIPLGTGMCAPSGQSECLLLPGVFDFFSEHT